MISEPLPSPFEIKKLHPITERQKKFIEQSRQTIKNILSGEDPRLLLVVGPCSIHDTTAALDYAKKLKALADEVDSSFFIVMRSYFEKSRTLLGWKGLLYDPYINGSNNIITGIHLARKFLIELAEIGVPAATEFLEPASAHYYTDLISWGCIGARTSISPIHRQLASGLPMPVGLKNATNGDVEIAVNAAVCASSPHTFFGLNEHGQAAIVHSHGNAFAHIVLRGGDGSPNYDSAALQNAKELLHRAEVPVRLLIDCSHDNSRKKHENQPIVFQEVLHQFLEGNKSIKGLLLESYLEAGSQRLPQKQSKLISTKSITDSCIDWSTTYQLIAWAHKTIESHQAKQSESFVDSSLALEVFD